VNDLDHAARHVNECPISSTDEVTFELKRDMTGSKNRRSTGAEGFGTKLWWALSTLIFGAGAPLLILAVDSGSWRASLAQTAWVRSPVFWAGAAAIVLAVAGPWGVRAVRGLRHLETALGLLAIVFAAGAAVALFVDGTFHGNRIAFAAPIAGAVSGLLWGLRRVWSQVKWERRPSAADEPLTRREEDCFGRDRLVRVICAALTTGHRCPRVAVVGPVGSGKTTIANFARVQLQSEGHVVARFDPWHHNTKEESTDALLETIENALREHSSPSIVWAAGRRAIRASLRALSEASFAAGLARPVEARLAVSQRDLEAVLRRALPSGKRLILLVDDLERCDDDRIREVLMRTHELFDAEGLAYLFTYDNEAVSKKLDDDFERLVSKTMDVSLRMTDPIATQLALLDDAWFKTLKPDPVDLRAAFAALHDVLPTVARERKLLHARLNNWPNPVTTAPASLDTRTLCALLLFEHYESGALQKLMHDDDLQSDIAMGATLEVMKRAAKVRAESDTDELIERSWSSERARELHRKIRESGVRNFKPHLDWLWHGASPATEQYAHLRERIAGQPGSSIDDLFKSDLSGRQDAWMLLGELRFSILEEAASAPLQQDVTRLIREAASISNVRARSLDRVLPLRPEAFARTTSRFFYWLRFGGIYGEAHDPEWRILSRAAATKEYAFDYLSALSHPQLDEETHEAISQLRAIVEAQCAERMADLIAEGQAAALIYAPALRGIVHDVLSRAGSAFFAESLRDRLNAAFASARKEEDGAGSLISILDILVGRGGDRYVDRDDVTRTLWRELTSEPLNRRLLGSLSEIREKCPEQTRDDLLPKPDWWEEILAEASRPWRPPSTTDSKADRT
jgi:hypothetical protein